MRETRSPRRDGTRVLGAACLLCFLLGSIHAFSVFLVPLEAEFGASRSTVSLTYSFALVCLTAAVLTGHRLFARVSAPLLAAAVCMAAALGTALAAQADSLPGVWAGYSLMFGGANGLGYAFGLQFAALANPGREGFAMGVVTGAYALGAAVSPILFSAALAAGGFSAAMIALAVALLLAAPVCAFALRGTGISFRRVTPIRLPETMRQAPILLLWTGYGTGVAAGLMAIGHAAAIAEAAGWPGPDWLPAALIALCNMAGAVAGGVLIDRIAARQLLFGLPLLSAVGLVLLIAPQGAAVLLTGLGIVGACYGATIAVFPAFIAKRFGAEAGAHVYGKVFTAWGAAGLAAPWFAGWIHDRSGGYALALVTAATLGLAAAAMARSLSRRMAAPS